MPPGCRRIKVSPKTLGAMSVTGDLEKLIYEIAKRYVRVLEWPLVLFVARERTEPGSYRWAASGHLGMAATRTEPWRLGRRPWARSGRFRPRPLLVAQRPKFASQVQTVSYSGSSRPVPVICARISEWLFRQEPVIDTSWSGPSASRRAHKASAVPPHTYVIIHHLRFRT